LVHILASDGHGASYRRPILSKGHERVAALIGEEAARRLVEEYPRAVIDDQPITPPPPQRVEGFEV
jgi:protein-tyrosine phosphatase